MTTTSRVVTPEQLDQLKSLVAALQAEDYGKAKQILVGPSLVKDLNDLLPALQDCHVKTLLELNDVSALEQTLDEQQKQLHHSSCSIDRAYILYRLSKYEQVLQLVSNDSNGGSSSSTEMLHAHLRAQSLYHMKQSSAAIQLYETLLTRDEESVTNDQVRAQLVANYLAAQASVATPYCCQSATNDVTQLVDNFESLLATEPDVALNHGILRAIESNDLRPLRVALQMAGDEHERAHARAALQAAASYWRGSVHKSTTTLPLSSSTALHAVHQHNQTLAGVDDARQTLEQLPPIHKKWTNLQTRIYRYNLACLQLRAKNHDACRATVKEMFAQWFDKSKQLKQQELNVAQSLWWQARLNVLLYYCDETTVVAASENDEEPLASSHDDPTNATSHTNKSLQLLRTTLDKLRALNACAVRDEAILYLMLHMREPLTVNSVPVSLQSRVGMQYTLGAAERNGDWYMAHGEYAQAVERYEQELKDDPNADATTRAKLVRALSHVDPDRALEMWQQAKGEITVHDENVLDQFNGAELERQELPRLTSSKMRTLATSTNDDLNQQSTTPEKDTKKSHDAILRRRSRQRQAHLDKLAAQGLHRVDRPVPPDPERWLPKYERSHNRKRRAKQQQQNHVHRGAQGSGVSEKESQKLDVVARQQARANGDASGSGGKSTAHLSVSGTGVVSKKSSRKK
ncbi:hypothetical protein MPSEU_000354600 [Mayamaea pseudoterrestris]|nr:hypothetical protein MPSEU_000354600 [Mayamaea pseudoterrestris]